MPPSFACACLRCLRSLNNCCWCTATAAGSYCLAFVHCSSSTAPQTAGDKDALLLLADYIHEIYIFMNDSNIITEPLTASFLKEFWQGQGALLPNTSVQIEPFIIVAGEILNYLRYSGSQALLPLLRQYSASNGTDLMVTDFSPDLLQQEVYALINQSTLNTYFTTLASKCAHNDGGAGSSPGTTDSNNSASSAQVNSFCGSCPLLVIGIGQSSCILHMLHTPAEVQLGLSPMYEFCHTVGCTLWLECAL